MSAGPPQPSPPPIDYGTPLVFLFREPGGVKALVVGGILFLFSWLIVPLLVLLGWTVALGRAVAKGEPGLPGWQIGLAGIGLRLLVVIAGYFAPILAGFVPFLFLVVLAEAGGGEPAPLLIVPFWGVSILLVALYALALAALQPAVLAAFVAEDRIAACFSPRILRQVIAPRGWSYLGLAAIVYGISQVVGVGIFLLVVGIGFTYFYYLAVFAHFAGQLARPLLPGAPPAGGPTTG